MCWILLQFLGKMCIEFYFSCQERCVLNFSSVARRECSSIITGRSFLLCCAFVFQISVWYQKKMGAFSLRSG